MKTIEQRQIQQMAAPVLLNYLLLTIFETLDKSIVGHYSVQGFAVIGIAETPIYEITGALGVLSSAFSMIAAQLQGKKNTADFEHAFAITRMVSWIIGLLFFLASCIGGRFFFRQLYKIEGDALEHLTKPKSDQSGSKGEKSQMDISPAFISDEQAPVSMEPGKGSLNNPAVLSKMRGTVHPTSGDAVLYMSHGARLSAKRKIVPFISVKFLRTTSGAPVQISQGWQMIQHIFQHFAIIHIGGSEADNERNAIAIRYEMMFASRTTSIYGVGSCVFAPLFAWMTEPSIQALLQSIFFVSCKFCRMTW